MHCQRCHAQRVLQVRGRGELDGAHQAQRSAGAAAEGVEGLVLFSLCSWMEGATICCAMFSLPCGHCQQMPEPHLRSSVVRSMALSQSRLQLHRPFPSPVGLPCRSCRPCGRPAIWLWIRLGTAWMTPARVSDCLGLLFCQQCHTTMLSLNLELTCTFLQCLGNKFIGSLYEVLCCCCTCVHQLQSIHLSTQAATSCACGLSWKSDRVLTRRGQ